MVPEVPLLDLKAQYAAIQEEIQAAIQKVLESQRFILGPEVQALEEEMAAYCQTQFGIGVASGTDALLLSLQAIGVGPGDAVITAPYSFFATAGTIARMGARPVFVDIDPATFTLDPLKLEALLTEGCQRDGPRLRLKDGGEVMKALIPVHLFGQSADMGSLLELAHRYSLQIIEDAAQAIGAECRVNNRTVRVGSLGVTGCLSFFPSKNLGGYGDGGMVVTNDPELARKIRMLRTHGGEHKYYNKYIGTNSRLDELQAAVLRVKFRYLDGWTRARQEHARFYTTLLSERCPEIQTPREAPYAARHIYNQYVIRVPERRDELHRLLKESGIMTEIYYPLPFHLQECFQYLGYRYGDFPQSERAAEQTLALPIFPELSREQQEFVVAGIEQFYRG